MTLLDIHLSDINTIILSYLIKVDVSLFYSMDHVESPPSGMCGLTKKIYPPNM
jgi:hypothetical protein